MSTTTITTTTLPVITATADTAVNTTINYHPTAEKGVFNTVTPGTVGAFRRKVEAFPVTISDIRGNESDFSLDKQGFQLVKHTSAEKSFEDRDAIVNTTYPEVEELLKKTTGASYVKVMSHQARLTPFEDAVKEIDERGLAETDKINKVSPVHFAHIDQGPLGAQQLFDQVLSEEERTRLGNTRWGIINVWRPIKPVRRNPLAVVDSRSVDASEDLQPIYTKSSKDTSEFTPEKMAKSYQSLAATHNPAHKWYYASGMTPDEVLMLRIYDTNKVNGAVHAAFTHPADEGEARQSVETRCLVFFESQKKE